MSDTRLVKLDITPGIYKNSTDVDSPSRWTDGDKVRFRDGKPEKIGGWVQVPQDEPLLGTGRDVFTWETSTGRTYTAIGTSRKLYVLSGGTFYDITPIESVESVVNNLSVTSGSSEVNINLATHGRKLGDFVVFFTPVGPIGTTITLEGSYEIIEIVDTNNFVIDAGTVATSTESGVGGSYDLSLELPIGKETNTPVTGYGAGGYGTGPYGTARESTSATNKVRLWSLAKWGNGLIASPSKGAIYFFLPTTTIAFDDRAEIIPNAPTQNLVVHVYDKLRQVIAFGTNEIVSGDFNPLLVRWSSAEDFDDWTPTDANEAGDYPLESGKEIVAVAQSKSEIIVGTDEKTFAMRFRGAPFYFGFDTLASNTEFTGKNCVAEVNGTLYWFGRGGFFAYNGSVKLLPSTLQDYIFDPASEGRLNVSQKEKVFAGVNREFSEIIWFYPSGDSEENNRYVIYNYRDNVWYDGTIDRTAWDNDSAASRPIAVSSTGLVYNHEIGKDDDGAIMDSFIESGALNISDGYEMIFVDRFIPDLAKQTGSLNLTIYSRKYPNGPLTTKGPFSMSPSKQFQSFRSRGRQFKFRLSSSSLSGDYQIGAVRFAFKPDGMR